MEALMKVCTHLVEFVPGSECNDLDEPEAGHSEDDGEVRLQQAPVHRLHKPKYGRHHTHHVVQGRKEPAGREQGDVHRPVVD